MSNLTDLFGPVISSYSRAQAIEDGVLVDVTEWASSTKGFIGGFTCSVAVTRAVFADLERKPKLQDVRGRAHDLLFMASLAARRGAKKGESVALFRVLMQVGRSKMQTYKLVAGPGDKGELVMTIMQPHED
jgi:hypothetical protein